MFILKFSYFTVVVISVLGLFAFTTANVSRNVQFTEIPTFPNDYKSVVETGDETLEPIYKFAKEFLDATVPVNFNIGLFDNWELTNFIEYDGLFSFIIAIIVIGLIIPIIGIIFAISRCAGCCGGKPSEKKSQQGKTLVIITGGFIVIFSAFLVFAIVIGLYSNIVMENGTENIFDKAIVTMQDTIKYSDNTYTQMKHLLHLNFEEFADDLSLQLADIGLEINAHINVNGKPTQLNEVIAGLTTLQEGIASLKATEASMEAIKSFSMIIPITNSVTMAIYQSCLREPVTTPAEGVCRQVEQVLSSLVIPQFSFPDVSSTITALDKIPINDYKILLNNIQGFGSVLTTNINELSIETKSKTNTAGAEIQSHLVDSKIRLDNVKDWLDDRIDDIEDAREYYDDYGSLRFGLTFMLPILLTIIVIFIIIGLLTGICCRTVKYKERNCCGNASVASEFFMINTSLIFIFTVVFAIAICVYYAFGLLGQRYICNTFDTMDNVEGLEHLDKYLDVEQFLGKGVTLVHVLKTCNDHKSIYEVLLLENEFNLAEIVEYLDTFGIKESLDKFKTTISDNVAVFSTNFPSDLLKELKLISLHEIEVPLYEDFVNTMAHLVQLLEEAYSLDSSLDAIPFVVQDYNSFISEFTGLKSNFQRFQTEIKMGGTLLYLERISQFDSYLDQYHETITNGNIVNIGNNLADACINSVQTYLNRIAEKMIDSVGLCEPASIAIKATLNEACGNIFNPANAFWVANFFALIAFIPLLIIFIYLVGYFRQYVMTEDDRIRLPSTSTHTTLQYYPYYPPGTQIQPHGVPNYYQATPWPQIPNENNIYSPPQITHVTNMPHNFPNPTRGDHNILTRGAGLSLGLGMQSRNLRRQQEYPYAMTGMNIVRSGTASGPDIHNWRSRSAYGNVRRNVF